MAATTRLPRTRGDRPFSKVVDFWYDLAPPHPRGSTPTFDHPPAPANGSPAPAGIDLKQGMTTVGNVWLPRTRGDRPPWRSRRCTRSGAPPHPRGSTPLEQLGGGDAAGSPAPAGIDPACRGA